MTAILTLTDFLLARIAEDEAVARAASEGRHWEWEGDDLMSDYEGEPYSWGTPRRECIIATEGANPPQPETTGAHIARHDPARVLAECEAKRQIVELHSDDGRDLECHQDGYGLPSPDDCSTLRLLALPYADHPDYRQEWKP